MARRNSRRERRTPNLKRGKYQREPKRRFILFCEGKNTEPAYFRAIERVCTSAQIEVQVEPAAGVPYTIAEKAVARAKSAGLAPRSRRVNSFEESDQVWAVFDRDEHPRFKEAVALCKHGSVNVAHSNPCFELWLLLHVQDHDRYEERSEIQRLLGKVRPDYVRDGGKAPDCDDLVTRLERAEQRAREQLTRREDSGDAFGESVYNRWPPDIPDPPGQQARVAAGQVTKHHSRQHLRLLRLRPLAGWASQIRRHSQAAGL